MLHPQHEYPDKTTIADSGQPVKRAGGFVSIVPVDPPGPDFGFQLCFDAGGLPSPKDDSDTVPCCNGFGFPCCEAVE